MKGLTLVQNEELSVRLTYLSATESTKVKIFKIIPSKWVKN